MPAPARKRSATLARPASESRPLLAVVLALVASFLLAAMLFHSAADQNLIPEWLEKTFGLPAASDAKLESNPCGAFGATVAVILFSLFGYAGFLIPVFLFAAAWFALNQRAHTLWPFKVTLMALCVILFAPILTHWLGTAKDISVAFDPRGAGGVLGNMLHGSVFHPVLGDYGTWILVFPYGFCLLGALADDPKATLASWITEIRDGFGSWNAERKAAAASAAEQQRSRAATAAELRRKQQEVVGVAMPVPAPKEVSKPAPELVEVTTGPDLVEPGNVTITPEPAKVEPPAREAKPPRKTPEPLGPDTGKVLVVQPDKIEKARASQVIKKRGDYVFPEIRLLNEPVANSRAEPEDFRKRAADLIETLKQFKVDCVPVDPANGVDVGIQQGPSITRYEIKPAPGVRVEKIANLSNNIAMNLEAEAVRILAPVPGKGTVGIEIPNKHRKDVLLREIIESKAWAESAMELPVVLGVDSVTNRPVIQDLAKMPHALIAGATGQGKSVCINAIIVSLLYRCTPQDLRFIMVDPKVVELQIYNNLPHLLIPVETDAKRVPAALKWLIAEMAQRYKIFAKNGVKNITGFNAKIAKDAGAPKQEELALSPDELAAAAAAAEELVDDGVRAQTEKLPYIVCIIDEMADLMMAAPQDIEISVARIAQLARAAGIHLVLATQRPSTDVITGLIKANLPTRIGFKVSSQIDSRTILDRGGAETLVGRGDMLFVPPGSAALNRVQGAFVGEQEVAAIVEFLAEKNGKPDFAQDVVAAIKAGAEGAEDGEKGDDGDDPLVAQSWAIIKETRRASVSMLQRRLKLGYNRAARIMDTLHDKGYVGPENGSSPREILVD
ncbi:MAG: cell division protein FtsK [Opitutia bacterium]|nr:DNA translocase FtsK [Opitutales bacterium]PHX79173.1 MAG: cell division protein FtsK [Opitutae bacterium]